MTFNKNNKDEAIEEILSIMRAWGESRKRNKKRDLKHAMIASLLAVIVILLGLFMMIYPYRDYF